MPWPARNQTPVVNKAQLSLTPMIDVVFLLLIFFMVGMKFRELDRRLDARLPRTARGRLRLAIHDIWIHIDAQSQGRGPARPRVVIDQVPMRDWHHAYAYLRDLARSPQTLRDPVILVPSDAARHGWVMTVMDYLHEIGYRNINFRQ